MSMVIEVLKDIAILVECLFYCIYCYFYVLIRNILPKHQTFKNVHGQVVLITGAAGGIGSILVRKFFDHGCKVICVDNDKINLDLLKKKLYKEYLRDFNTQVLNSRLKFYETDVRSAADVGELGAKLKNDFKCVDILINNAGVMNHGKCLLELEEKEVRNIFDANILSHFWLCKEFLDGMLIKKTGHIVNVSSACGQMGAYKLTDYCSTKFAVVGFTESLRIELKSKYPNANVKCSIVCPFLVRTKLFNGVEFRRLKWLNLNMDADYVSQNIFEGILMEKELIYIPSLACHFFFTMRQLVTTKFLDYSCKKLELNDSMDLYKKKS